MKRLSGILVGLLLSTALWAATQPPKSADGWYEVSTPDQLCWISDYVNAGHVQLNVRLMNDLDMAGVENFTPIGMYTDTGGKSSLNYTGNFDGQKHIIYNLNVYMDDTYEAGLFSRINGGTLQNLGIVNATVTNTTNVRSGIFGGEIYNSTVSNCFSAGNLVVDTSHGQAGGIAGECVNTTVYDSYTTMDVLGYQGTFTRCYTSSTNAASGELCYLLNGSTMLNPTWYQTLGQDAYPVWDNTHGLVYQTEDGSYADIHSQESFITFRDDLIQQDKDYLDSVIATQIVINAYRKALLQIADQTDRNTFLTLYEGLTSKKTAVQESESCYASYINKVQESKEYLESNPSITGTDRDFLMTYITDTLSPGTYPRGSFCYIIQNHTLANQYITAECTYVQGLLSRAVVNGFGAGADITQMLDNPDFSEGWKNWQGQTGTSYGGIEGGMHAAECSNSTCDLYQTLSGLKNGVYMVRLNGAFLPCGRVKSTNYGAVIYANEMQNYLQAVSEDAIPVSQAQNQVNCYLAEDAEITDAMGRVQGYAMNSVTGAAYAFSAGRYGNSILTMVNDGTLKYGVRVYGTGCSSDWAGFGNVQLIYCGTMGQASTYMDEVLASQAARAKTLLAYEPSQGTDCVYAPNFSAQIRQALSQAIESIGEVEDFQEKYTLIETFSDLFQQVYECKQVYKEMGLLMESIYNNYAADTSASQSDLNALEEMYAEVWDGYYEGSFTTEEATSYITYLRQQFPTYMQITGTLSRNNMSFQQTGVGTYQVQTLGGDPYISMSTLTNDLTDDQTIFTFEYISDKPLPSGEIFFAYPLEGGREQGYGSLEAAEDWTAVFLDISESRKNFNWGYAGNWLRWDPVSDGSYTFQMRRMRIVTPEQKQEIIDSMPRVVELKPVEDAPIYDLQGRQLEQKPEHGLYIQNGRKISVR